MFALNTALLVLGAWLTVSLAVGIMLGLAIRRRDRQVPDDSMEIGGPPAGQDPIDRDPADQAPVDQAPVDQDPVDRTSADPELDRLLAELSRVAPVPEQKCRPRPAEKG